MGSSTSIKINLDASSFNSEAQKMAQSLKTVQSELKASDAALASSGTKVQQLENKYKSLQTQLKMQSDITKKYESAVKASGTAQDAARTKLEKTKSAYESGRKQYEANVKSLGAAQDAARVKLEQSKQAYESGKKEYSANSSELKKLKSEVNSNEKELKKLDKEAAKNEKTFKNLEKAVASDEKALNRASIAHEKSKSNLANSRAEQEKLRNTLNATSTELQKEQSFIGRVNSKFEEMHSKTEKLQQGLTRTGRTLTVGLTTPLVALGTKIVKTSENFNKSLANIGTLNVDNSRLLELKSGIQEVAVEVGKDTTDIADGVYQVVSAYGDTADTLEMTKINAKAAAAGLSTTTDAINLTSAVIKGYGEVSAEATQKASDLAFETVRLGQTTFPQLAASIGKVVPAANALGTSQEELFGVFATLTGVTGDAAEVSTQLGSIFTALMKPSDAMTQALNKMGYESGFAAVKALGLQGTLAGLVDVTGGSDEALVQLAGRKEAVTAMLSLTGAQADTFSKKLGELQNAAGATDRAFAAQTEGVAKAGFTFQQAMVKMQVAAQQFGDSAAPFIDKGANSVSGLADWLNSLDDSGRQKLINIGIFLAAIGPAASIASKGITLVQYSISALNAIKSTKAISSLTTALVALPLPAKVAVGAIAALTYTTYKGVKAYQDYKEAQFNYAEGLSETVDKVKESVSAYRELSDISAEVKELQFVINSSDSSKEDVEAAKTRLEEIKSLLAEKYQLTIDVDDDKLDKVVDVLTAEKRNDAVGNINNTLKELGNNNRKSSYESSNKDIADITKSYNNAKFNSDSLQKAVNGLELLNRQYKAGTIGADEFYESTKKIATSAGFGDLVGLQSDFDSESGFPSLLNAIKDGWNEAKAEADDYNTTLKGLKENQEEYRKSALDTADSAADVLRFDSANGNFSDIKSDLSQMELAVKYATNGMNDAMKNVTVDEFAKKAAAAQSNLDDVSKAYEIGGDTLRKVSDDYISASQQFGASAEQTAVGAALIESGFNDIGQAAQSEGGLEKVAEKATEIGRRLEELDGDHSINVSANGDLIVVDEAADKVEKIDGKNVDIQLNADGNYEVIDEFGETVQTFDGKAVNVQINADGDYEMLDEAKEVMATVDGETAEVNFIVNDETEEVIAGTEQEINRLNGKTAYLSLNADGTQAYATINGVQYQVMAYDEATGTALLSADGTTASATINVTTGEVRAFSNERGTATLDAEDLASGKARQAASAINNIKGKTVQINAVFSASGDKSKSFFGFAKGTSNAPGGPAVVNDDDKEPDPRELIERDGHFYMAEGRNVPIMTKPGDKIWSAPKTKQIFKSLGIKSFASGTGDSAFDTAKKAFQHRQKTSEVSVVEELEWWKEIQETMQLAEDEAQEVEENIYSLTKELNKQSIDDYKDRISDQIEDGKRWLNFQVKINHMSYDDQIATLKRIDDKHLATLDEMVRNTEMTEKEKDEIYKEYYKAHEDRIIEIAELEKEKAQEVYETKMQLSEDYFSNRTFYGDWDEYADNPIEAYGRVRDRIYGDIASETDPDVVKDKLQDLADFGEKVYDDRRQDSKDWMSSEEYYGDMTTQKKLDAIKRQHDYTKQYYKEGIINQRKYYEEMAELDKEYFSVVKELLDEAVDDYYDAQKEQLDIKRKAIEDEYDLEKEKENTDDRNAKLKKLRQQEAMFDGAVTIEGKNRLEEIREEIASLEKEAANEAREKEKERRLSDIDDEEDELERQHEAALKGTSKYAKEIAGVIGDSNDAAAQGFNALLSSYTKQQEEIAANGAATIGSIVDWTNNKLKELSAAESAARAAANNLAGSYVTGDTNYHLHQTNYNTIADRTDADIYALSSVRAFRNVIK